MKKILLFATAIALSLNTFAQTEEEMKAWMEFSTPSDMHKMMGKYNGVWEVKTKMWMAPGAEVMESTAQATNDMHMGDRYQKSSFAGEFMGMPFNGESTTGYDNMRKVFTTTWIDNTGTGVMIAEGNWNATTKSIEYKGMASDPMAGKQTAFREVMTFADDSYKMEMYNMAGDKEFKSMEMTFTRKN